MDKLSGESENTASAAEIKSDSPSTSSASRLSQDKTGDDKSKKQKHASDFDVTWKEGRPWLIYVPGSGMFCSYCKAFDKKPFGRETWNKVGCMRISCRLVA